MNRLQRTICHVTNGALTGAILYLTFVPTPTTGVHQQPVELMSEAGR